MRRNLVKVRKSYSTTIKNGQEIREENKCIAFKIITRDKERYSEFLVTYDEIDKLQAEQRIIVKDIYSFAAMYHDQDNDLLHVDFSFIERYGNGDLRGRHIFVSIPAEQFFTFYHDYQQEQISLLTRNNDCYKTKLIFTDSAKEQLQKAIENKQVRNKLRKAIMHFATSPVKGEKVILSRDFVDYSFTFSQYRGDQLSMHGGLILHKAKNDPELKKARYSIHT